MGDMNGDITQTMTIEAFYVLKFIIKDTESQAALFESFAYILGEFGRMPISDLMSF